MFRITQLTFIIVLCGTVQSWAHATTELTLFLRPTIVPLNIASKLHFYSHGYTFVLLLACETSCGALSLVATLKKCRKAQLSATIQNLAHVL